MQDCEDMFDRVVEQFQARGSDVPRHVGVLVLPALEAEVLAKFCSFLAPFNRVANQLGCQQRHLAHHNCAVLADLPRIKTHRTARLK